MLFNDHHFILFLLLLCSDKQTKISEYKVIWYQELKALRYVAVVTTVNAPYCGVNVAPQTAHQSRNTNNRHRPLDNPAVNMDQEPRVCQKRQLEN